MNKINYWDILTEEERTALTLSIQFDKSTWEAGEIMKKPHYKFLEIKARAERFTRLFIEYYQKWPTLIPDNIPLSRNFIQFLQLTILERKPPHDAVKLLDNLSYMVISARTRLIKIELDKLKSSKSNWGVDFYKLILEFDRWNNIRILPAPLQQPSAFKRRNKIKILKHFKGLSQISQFTALELIRRYNYMGKYEKLYTVIFSPFIDTNYKVITIKKDPEIIQYFNSLGFPLFTDIILTEEFGGILAEYLFSGKRTCILGQKFWPRFREILLLAQNYNNINNIIEKQRYLENAGV